MTRLDALETTVKTPGNGKRKVTAIAVDDDEERATAPPPPQSAGASRYVPRRPQMTHHAARAKHPPPPPPDMPDDLWLMHELMILSMYHEGQGLHTLKMLRDIAWGEQGCCLLGKQP